MDCTEHEPCNVCGGVIRLKVDSDRDSLEDPNLDYICGECTTEYKKILVCSGKIKKVWTENGEKIIDCICEKCGASYGRDAIARGVLLEKFSAV